MRQVCNVLATLISMGRERWLIRSFRYYGVKTGDYCQLIAINNTISVDLFEAINPSIDTGCTNLVPGFYYCVFPVLGWNETTSTTSTYVTPPAPTPSGTTGNCYEVGGFAFYFVLTSQFLT